MKLASTLLTFVVAFPLAASPGLTKEESRNPRDALWAEHREAIQKQRAEEMEKREITIGEHTMRFESTTYGSKPEDGWSLFISLHGGGGAPTEVNDSQWRNQLRLGDGYRPKDALYLAPRAPTDAWNMWHQGHIDLFLDRLIENLVVLNEVNPDAVYLMGYSAGGDGVYQLAPRMADRLAGAAMMAGHPNDASPLGLRNIGFAIHVGEEDVSYQRNSVAMEWKTRLEKLNEADDGGYQTQVQIHRGKGHWMGLEDKIAVPWLQEFVRNPHPRKVVWQQDDVIHETFYWLAMPGGSARQGQQVVASIDGQTVSIEKAENMDTLLLRFNDELLDLDQKITVLAVDGSTLFEGKLPRSRETAERTFEARRDKAFIFFSELLIDLKANRAIPTTLLQREDEAGGAVD